MYSIAHGPRHAIAALPQLGCVRPFGELRRASTGTACAASGSQCQTVAVARRVMVLVRLRAARDCRRHAASRVLVGSPRRLRTAVRRRVTELSSVVARLQSDGRVSERHP
jgi:hypothetical protein